MWCMATYLNSFKSLSILSLQEDIGTEESNDAEAEAPESLLEAPDASEVNHVGWKLASCVDAHHLCGRVILNHRNSQFCPLTNRSMTQHLVKSAVQIELNKEPLCLQKNISL